MHKQGSSRLAVRCSLLYMNKCGAVLDVLDVLVFEVDKPAKLGTHTCWCKSIKDWRDNMCNLAVH